MFVRIQAHSNPQQMAEHRCCQAGVTHCFVNLGSDHPSILEAIAQDNKEPNGRFPRIITCPHEVLDWSISASDMRSS